VWFIALPRIRRTLATIRTVPRRGCLLVDQ
jgi:hypothetical protein